MADVEVKYKGETKKSTSSSGTLTCTTRGKYCEADIIVEYTKPTPAAGAIASNITTTDTDTYVPLISTAGYLDVKYASAITVPLGKTLNTLTNYNSINTINNSALITTLNNSTSIGTLNNNYEITSLINTDSGISSINSLTNRGIITTLTNSPGEDGPGRIANLINSGTISGGQNTGNITINNYDPDEGYSGNITINDNGRGSTTGGDASAININNFESQVNLNTGMTANIPATKGVVTLNVNGSIGSVENISSTGKVAQINNNGSIGDSSFIGVDGIINNSNIYNLVNSGGTVHSFTNSGTFGDSSYSYGDNTGNIYINHGTSGSGNVYVKPYGGNGTKVINNGSFVSPTYNLSSLVTVNVPSTSGTASDYDISIQPTLFKAQSGWVEASAIPESGSTTYYKINRVSFTTSSTAGTTSKLTVTPTTSDQYIKAELVYGGQPGLFLGTDYIKINAVSLEAKTATAITLGTAVTPSSSYSGMSSFTLNGGGTITNPSGITTSLSNQGTVSSFYNYTTTSNIQNIPSSSSGTATITSFSNGAPISSGYAGTITTLTNNQSSTISTLNNKNIISTLTNSGTIGSSSYTGSNTGTIYINHDNSESGNLYAKAYHNGAMSLKAVQLVGGGYWKTPTFSGTASPMWGPILTISPTSSTQYLKCSAAGVVNVDDWIQVNAVSLETKTASSLTLGTAITPSSSYSGLSSFTLNGGGTVTNPSGYSTSISNGGTIATLTNTSTITTLSNTNTISTLTNSRTISNLTGTGTISSINGGASQYIAELGNSSGIGSLYIKCINGKTGTMYGNVYIGADISSASGANASLRIYNQNYSTTEASDYLCIDVNSGKNLMYLYNKNGTVRTIANYGTTAGTSTVGSLGNGASTSGYLGVITSLNNTANGTITTLTNSGTITNLKMDGGTIGDSETATSSSTGQKGLYGTSGIIYVSATGSSTPASSIYRLNNLTLKAGSSTTYYGAFLTSLNVNPYAQIGTETISANGRVKSFSNSGYLGCDATSYNYSSGYIGNSSYPIDNRGNIYIKHGSSGSGNVYARASGETANVSVILSGKWNAAWPARSTATVTCATGVKYIWFNASVAGNATMVSNYSKSTTYAVGRAITASTDTYLGQAYPVYNASEISIISFVATSDTTVASGTTLKFGVSTSSSTAPTSWNSYTTTAVCRGMVIELHKTTESTTSLQYRFMEIPNS